MQACANDPARGLVTWWPSLLETNGTEEEIEWVDLFARFADPTEFRGDKQHPGWSPARFDPCKRELGNVHTVSAACLDYDGTLGIEGAKELWWGFFGFLHTTRRHTEDVHRFRIILPLLRHITPAEFAALWPRLNDHASGLLDPNAKDASRFWFQPGPMKGNPYHCELLDGEYLDPDRWLAIPLSEPEPIPQGETSDAREKRAVAYIAKMDPAISGQRGHLSLWNVARKLAKDFRFDEDTVLRLLREHYNPRCVPVWSEKELRHKASDAVNKARLANPIEDREHPTGTRARTAPALPDDYEHSDEDAPDAPPKGGHLRVIQGGGESTPEIRLGVDLHRVIDEAVAVLDRDATLYQREAEIVRVVRVQQCEVDRERMAPGSHQIRSVLVPHLRERLTRIANWARWDARKEEWLPTTPPDKVLTAVLERAEWPTLRPITAITDTPSIRPDGSLLESPGYDPATGYVFIPSRAYPAVKPCPTIDDAHRALDALLEPWVDFPFRNDVDRYVPIAAMLSLVARPAIRGACPAFVIDASTRGSGKTLISRALTLLAHGREAALMSWPDEDVEREKLFGAYALRAAQVIVFDNIKTTFGGGPLDKILTCADRTEFRILGESTIPSLAWRAVTIATGNNVRIGGDTSRRVLICRLEPDCEKPEERTGWQIPRLVEWCDENHPRMVGAALTLLRAYFIAGRPDQSLPGWGSFEAWSALVASALTWAGAPSVMLNRPTIAGEEDEETAALRSILEFLPRLAESGASLRVILQALYPTHDDGIPDGFDALREAFESLAPPRSPGRAPDARTLGNALNRVRRRVLGGKYLERKSGHGNVLKWVVRTAGQ